MASLWKRSESKFWFACFTDIHGKQRKCSTKTTDRRLAQKIADEFESAARAKRTAQQTQKIIASLHELVSGEKLATTTFRQFVASWLAVKEPETSEATIAFYKKTSTKFIEFLGDKADASIAEITRKQITDFRNAEAKQISPSTINNNLKCLRMMFKVAKRDGLIAEDPTEFVEAVKQRGDKTTRRAFTVPELQAVLSVADEEWRSMFFFGLYTGQRLGDIAALTWQNIDLQSEEIRLVTAKTGKRLIIPIAAPLQKHLEKMAVSDEPDEALHPRAFEITSKQGRIGHLSNQFAEVLVQAGLREKKSHRKIVGKGRKRAMDASGLSFHSLRHTAVSMMKDAGISEAAVMELVGHDSEQMSQHYTHVGRDALEKAANALPDLF